MKKEKELEKLVREAKKLIAHNMEETDKMKKVLARIKELKK